MGKVLLPSLQIGYPCGCGRPDRSFPWKCRPLCFSHAGASLLTWTLLIVSLLPAPILSQLASEDIDCLLRVGARIDTMERSYFSLFPAVSGFDSARVARNGGTFYTTVYRSVGGVSCDSIFPLAPTQFAMLKDYLDLFEEICGGSDTTKTGRHLRTYYAPLISGGIAGPTVLPYHDPERVEIELFDAPRVSGTLLSANQYLLVIGTDGGFRLGMERDAIRTLFSSRVRVLRVEGTGSIFPGVFYGAVAGFSLGYFLFNYSGTDIQGGGDSFQLILGLMGTFWGAFFSVLSHPYRTLYESDAPEQSRRLHLLHLAGLQKRAQFPGIAPPEIRRAIDRAVAGDR